MRTTQAAKKRPTGELGEFFGKYGAVLEAIARRVHAQVERGVAHTPSKDLARWIAHDLPTLYRAAFGKSTPKRLKQWRVMTMMSNANYLGAYECLDIRAVPGRGVTSVVKPRKVRRGPLTVIQGGKSKKAG